MDLVEAICDGDCDSVGNMLMDSYFDKIEAQLSPIEHVADYLNDRFDPEWQADSEAIKKSICERLEGISNDSFVDRICDIAETLSDIFHGLTSPLPKSVNPMLAWMLTALRRNPRTLMFLKQIMRLTGISTMRHRTSKPAWIWKRMILIWI